MKRSVLVAAGYEGMIIDSESRLVHTSSFPLVS
jgi:hypothetical protein